MASENTTETPSVPAGGPLAARISRPEGDANPPSTEAEKPAAEDDSGKGPSIPQVDGASEDQRGSELQDSEFDVNVKLSDLQADPNNPLYSIKSFEELGLAEPIQMGLSKMNFRRPSKIQERALPLLMANPPTNMIAQSQSGTGKTAAFVLNILSRLELTPEKQKSPQALVLAPSRELARQIVGVIQAMGTFVEGLFVATAVPMEMNRNQRVEASIVVGTPGTVQDLIKKRLFNTQHLRVLVLDEADNMLDQQGLGDQCIRVKSLLPRTIQVVLFSATFPDFVVRYAHKFAPNSNQLTLKHEELTVEGIKQLYLDCESDEHKYEILVKFYGLLTIGSSIIFVKTRASAAEIERRMVAEGHTVVSLTGGIEGQKRDEIIDRFRNGTAKVLITTNVLARGIDVSTVSMVINYDIPELHLPGAARRMADAQTYLHRIGRTGRFGRVGVAVSFVSNQEEWQMLQDIQKYFSTNIERVDTRDWDDVEKKVKKIIKPSAVAR
ncbi:ATP-dependent RNA helicase DBP5 [Coccidioides immitis RS]|uniref:ATP-dependent RNA helicase DBP5 n=4 Tax=Coccidioides TaxID=5500 RepID=DBP5_COCIM|nr:ATP-dependent RNA helicase DBP5 [Coccidioides immitis RS]XP_003066748.1 ATP-dependent RNA helicase, putative [Coccidioides posadasii C735 delta SOWgp]Q1EB85.1 RecName: Full=ATP-dependent RNA helicase DBP5 [Coccidioides immitis RS]EFW18218.1 ATP-dependent RNA helicase DBP5 [Coccidioides posadasii str. Silveira]KMM66392.1 ATP-dependent RNA helicase dbp5 [Coccidioides posadasii RMSCC 3488]EAS34824.3 ATP-dependent RNA helicase DBP5 [Coccidioides immitis RS]EER24603.1 ATP-dependent RNA helicase|eukprot:XP_003066748.1 ATP-dependent RNA helicase, putative [Coccidioides posadasii C735 delta SOWgp]